MNDCPRQNPAYRPALTPFNSMISMELMPFIVLVQGLLQMLLQKRSQIFYFRWVVPADMRYLIPQTELIKSLRTKCEATALMRSARWLDIVQRIRDIRDKFRMNELTAANYEEVIQLLWDKAKNDPIKFPRSDNPLATVSGRLKYFTAMGHGMSIPRPELTGLDKLTDKIGITNKASELTAHDQYMNAPPDAVISLMANEALRNEGISVPDKEMRKKVSLDYLPIEIHRLQRQLNFLEGREDTLELIKVSSKATSVSSVSTNTPALSQVLDDFLAFKVIGGLTEKIQKEYHRYITDVLDLMGDKPVCHLNSKAGNSPLFDSLFPRSVAMVVISQVISP